MKKFILTMVTLLTVAVGAKAMGYEQARQQALFLTDKMAYELNLSEQQYEAAYEINLDYLMSVNTVDDLYAEYWRQRNFDMQAIFYDWQWDAFCAASYFYRPLYWDAGVWHFGVYAHYPYRDFFFYSRPVVWVSYRGGHSWRLNGGVSWYAHHHHHYRPEVHHGMRHHSASHHGGASHRPGSHVPSHSHSGSGASIHRPSSTRSSISSAESRQHIGSSRSSASSGGFSHSSGMSSRSSGSYSSGSHSRSTGAAGGMRGGFGSGSHSSGGFSGGSRSGGGFSSGSHGGGSFGGGSHSGGGSRGGGGFSGSGSHGGRR